MNNGDVPMNTFRSLEDLSRFREEIHLRKREAARRGDVQILVSLGTCGIAAGALNALRAVRSQVELDGLNNVTISQIGCIGLCRHEPIVEVIIGESPKVTYGGVTPEVARRIVREHVLGGQVVSSFVIESVPYPSI
jgi:NADP-reducing hydrogenase subunit HndB